MHLLLSADLHSLPISSLLCSRLFRPHFICAVSSTFRHNSTAATLHLQQCQFFCVATRALASTRSCGVKAKHPQASRFLGIRLMDICQDRHSGVLVDLHCASCHSRTLLEVHCSAVSVKEQLTQQISSKFSPCGDLLSAGARHKKICSLSYYDSSHWRSTSLLIFSIITRLI